MGAWVDIFIRDYTEDPIDEGAFAINVEVQWPSPEVSYVRISFAERFIEKLFHISWHKDLGVEDKRLTKDRREVFIQWGLIRLERWIPILQPPCSWEWTTAQAATRRPSRR